MSEYERTGAKIPKYLKHRGNILAKANKHCHGTSNKHGAFYRCVKKQLAKK